MKSVLKSLLLAFAGTGLVFFFLMMAVIPMQALFARLGGNVAKASVVVSPTALLRTAGIPLAVVVFIVLFSMSFYRMHNPKKQALSPHR